METRTLIATNADKAERKIKTMLESARVVNEKLSILYEVEGMEPLKSKEEAIEFLRDPATGLEKKIVESFGGDFNSGKRKLNGKVLAGLYNIPFDDILSNFRHISYATVTNCDLDKKGFFTVNKETETAIYEEMKDYIESEAEEKAFQLQKDMADAVTNYIKVFDKLEFPLYENQRAAFEYLGIETGLKDGEIILQPDIRYIRRRLNDESKQKTFLERVKKFN
ncbi:hypothetical protein [Marinilabilia salmonicolor]|uniref:hypothetical protein n=1 Tax=Marinilabilia salmonicolor TaxID=989 RepID=UPI00029ABFAB|nr:hypothetical protein [Marinilabilia salmonicolor]